MKIAFATDGLPNYHVVWGGAEQACYRLSKLLIKNGHEVSIISTRPNKIPREDFDFFTVKVIEDFFPEKIRYFIRQLKSAFFPLDPLAGLSSYRILKRTSPNLLHLHNIHSLSFALLVSAKRLKIPIILSVYDYGFLCPPGFLWILKDFDKYEGIQCTKFHGTHCIHCITKQRNAMKIFSPLLIPFLFFRQKILNYLLQKIDGFIVLSESNADVLEKYGIERKKIGVVQIPMDEEEGEEDSTSRIEENSILFIGWLHPRKGPHVVVNAMPHILEKVPEAKLYIFGGEKGNKEYKRKLLSTIRENGMVNNVLLMGKRPFSEVRECLKKANVLVIPETWETISTNTLTEGFIFGKAIVASRVGGSKDYIINGENGLLADNNDPIDFAEKIVSILENKRLMTKLGRKAKENGKKLFSEREVRNRLINFYNTTLSGKK